jgi:hypothetical protein
MTKTPVWMLKGPAQAHQRELDQDEPEAAREQEPTDLADAASAFAVKERGNAGEEDKGRRAKVRHPARQEQCGIGNVARVGAARGEEIAGMVERHQQHDEPAQQVDAVETRAVRYARHVARARSARNVHRSQINPGHASDVTPYFGVAIEAKHSP